MFVFSIKEARYLKFEDCLIFSTENFLQKKKIFISLISKELIKDTMTTRYFYELINVKLVSLRGGGKKKKKKKYTKPKKIKHVRKKIQLKVLRYYSVSGTSVLKLRKESPESPGCFLAEHKDRLTCGKTGITFIKNNS